MTLDTNIQHIISEELNKALITFDQLWRLIINGYKYWGSFIFILPNFDINIRTNIKNDKYINKITKGVYELGSIFKTFTVALALENNIVTPKTIIRDIPK